MTEPLARHQVLLFAGDFDRLKEYYTVRSATDVIRTLVRNHLNQLDAEVRKNGNRDTERAVCP